MEMHKEKVAALAAIDEKKELIAQAADKIWDYAELSMQEVQSAALLCSVMEQEGFAVEKASAPSPRPSPPATVPASPSSAFWRSMTPCPV